MFKGFKEFILRGNVVELAVAVVLGAAFKAVIDAVVDLLTNLIAIPGDKDFSTLQFEIGGGVFKYGILINAVIAFLAVALVIYFVIIQPLNRLAERRRSGAEPEPEARAEDVLLLEEIRDLLAAQQAAAAPGPKAARAPRPAPE